MDLILRGARIVDGTRRAVFKGDVAIEDGTIRAVGDVGAARAAREVDLEGLVLSPGFIDSHTHYDPQVFWDPDLTPSSWNGVTTVVMANCGFGIAPVRSDHHDLLIRTLERVEGMPAEVLRAGVPWGWETFPQYFDAVAKLPKRINTGVFIGHTAIRFYVMGAEAQDRAAKPDEIERMRALVREAIRHGAIGFSTTVRPTALGAYGKPIPSILATNEEIEALMRVLGEEKRGVIAITHGPGKDDFWIDQFGRMARETGRPFAWAPLLTGEYGGKGRGMEILEWAHSQKTELYSQFSCLPTSTQFNWRRPGLFGARHPATKEVADLPHAEKLERMRDPAWKERVRRDLDAEPRSRGIFERMYVAESAAHPELLGQRLSDVAAKQARHASDLWIELALDDDLDTRYDLHITNLDEDDLAKQMQDPSTMITLSDAGAHPGELSDAAYPAHLLGYWVRDAKALSLEDAVWRLTGQMASAYRVEGRGVIAPGKVADLVAFNSATVGIKERKRLFDLPTGSDRLVGIPKGVEHIWVGGVQTRKDGADVAGAAPGAMVRGLGDRLF